MQLVSYMSPGFPHSLFEAIARCIDVDLRFEEAVSGPAPGNDPFARGTADLGWICSTSYVDLALRAESPSIRLAGVAWVPDDPDCAGRPVYFGDLVVRSDSAVGSLTELRGNQIACNDIVSLSGHHALRFAMHELGVDPDRFADLVFTGGHHASLDAVLAGTVDAAVVDSVVRIGRARHDPAVADLRVIERLGPWPVQPLVIRADLAEPDRRRIEHRLLEASQGPELRAELEAAALTNLVAVGADHYDGVRRAMAMVEAAG